MTKKEFAAEEVADLEKKLEQYQNAISHIQIKLDFWKSVLDDKESVEGGSGGIPGDGRVWDRIKEIQPRRYKTVTSF